MSSLTHFCYSTADFKCPTCCGLRVEDPAPNSLENVAVRRHVYTHPLVQCKRLVPDPEANPETEQKTTDSRLAKLEERMEELQKQLVKLENKQEAMEERLISRLTEALSVARTPSGESRQWG